MSQSEQVPADNDVEMADSKEEPKQPGPEPNQFLKDSKLLRKLTDAILFQPSSTAETPIDESEFLIDTPAENGEQPKIEKVQVEKKFKTLDRFLIYLLNNSLLAENEKS